MLEKFPTDSHGHHSQYMVKIKNCRFFNAALTFGVGLGVNSRERNKIVLKHSKVEKNMH